GDRGGVHRRHLDRRAHGEAARRGRGVGARPVLLAAGVVDARRAPAVRGHQPAVVRRELPRRARARAFPQGRAVGLHARAARLGGRAGFFRRAVRRGAGGAVVHAAAGHELRAHGGRAGAVGGAGTFLRAARLLRGRLLLGTRVERAVGDALSAGELGVPAVRHRRAARLRGRRHTAAAPGAALRGAGRALAVLRAGVAGAPQALRRTGAGGVPRRLRGAALRRRAVSRRRGAQVRGAVALDVAADRAPERAAGDRPGGAVSPSATRFFARLKNAC